MQFFNPWPTFLDDNGDPYTGGRLSFFEAGTTTPKVAYADHLLVTPLGTTILLDAGGVPDNEAGVHFGTGEYDVVLESLIPGSVPPEYTVERTYPNYQGTAVGLPGDTLTTATVASIEDLRTLPQTYDLVRVLNYYGTADRGGRVMYADPSSSDTDNGGTIISPNGAPATFRWKWLPDTNVSTVDAQLFGILPDLVVGSQITAMDQWVTNSSFDHIVFSEAGDYLVNASVSLNSSVVEVGAGVRFKANTGANTLTINGTLINHGTGELCLESAVQPIQHLIVSNGEVRSEWWGNNTHAIQQCILGSTGAIRISGTNTVSAHPQI